MKTEKQQSKKIDAVKMMREIRDKMDKETKGMSYDEFKAYLQSKKSGTSAKKDQSPSPDNTSK